MNPNDKNITFNNNQSKEYEQNIPRSNSNHTQSQVITERDLNREREYSNYQYDQSRNQAQQGNYIDS